MPAASRTNPSPFGASTRDAERAGATVPPAAPSRDADRAIRAIVARWRRLTGGGRDAPGKRRTLIACSGGADSTALALALGTASKDLVLAHIRHDFRPESETAADLAGVDRLGAMLSIPVEHAPIRVADLRGNAESNARGLRYEALAQLAARTGCPFIATAHHADDQLETVLMRLIRGSGAAGLAGIAETRAMRSADSSCTLIRPMLGVGRTDAEAICLDRSIAWREDATNHDLTRTRAAIRSRVLPELRAIAPRAAARATETAAMLGQIASYIGAEAARHLSAARVVSDDASTLMLACAPLAPLPDALLGEIVRTGAIDAGGGRGADDLPRRLIERVCRAIREQPGPPRRFICRAAEIEVSRGRVAFRPRQEDLDE